MNDVLTIKHGVPVREGAIAISGFLREVTERGNSRFEGSFEELIDLAHKHFDDNEPGTGSVDGDVLLVRVPNSGFNTNIVEITADNAFQVEEVFSARVDGEEPVPTLTIYSRDPLPQANVVKLVLYRADVLEQDSDRSSDAEWEIVAINAQPEENTPMHPQTMLRNTKNETGGTYREYTSEEWQEAEDYWGLHAFIKTPPEDREY